jgi:hypothetical protein
MRNPSAVGASNRAELSFGAISMQLIDQRSVLTAALCLALAVAIPASVQAQESELGLKLPETPLVDQARQGREITLESYATGEERTSQRDLWILEVTFKPVRMIWVDLTDPKTGEKSKQLVWYLPYRAVNRPIEGPRDDSDTAPVNTEDEPVNPPLFVPEFTLVVEDPGIQKIYEDEVLPEAQAVINKRERVAYKNSVEIVGPIPPIVPKDAKAPPTDSEVIEGVATWRGIDPETDFFTIYMTGFSNGYKITKGPDGQPWIERKTIRQKYWRPGDRFNPHEREIRWLGQPEWLYRPEEAVVPPFAGEAVAETDSDQNPDGRDDLEK